MKKSLLIAVIAICSLLFFGCDTTTVDSVKPVFNGVEDGKLAPLTVNVKSTADLLKDVSAKDETSLNVTITVDDSQLNTKVVGSYTVTYSAVDEAGNIATIERIVNVVDTVGPLFVNAPQGTFMEKVVLQNQADVELIESTELFEARDNYDTTDLVAYLVDDGEFDITVAGEYTVTYGVKDSSGNETRATRKFVVKESITYVEDVVKVNGVSHPVILNYAEGFKLDANNGAKLRARDEFFLYDKATYLALAEEAKNDFTNTVKNGGVIYLPYCVLVVLDSSFNPVLVRNATYAVEMVLVEGEWKAVKNGTVVIDGEDVTSTVSFIDGSAPSAEGVGIMGGNLESYIPDGGYLLIGTASKGGSLDTGKILLISNCLDSDFGGGALVWAGVEVYGVDLMNAVKFELSLNETSIYEKPDAMETPVITMEKHVLSWSAITGAKDYNVYINGELKTTTSKTSLKMIDLGLEPSAEGEHYEITVKANTSDIRFYSDSEVSEKLDYVMPNAVVLPAPTFSIADGVLTIDPVEGAVEYEIVATITSDTAKDKKIEKSIAVVTDPSYSLKDDTYLATLMYVAKISVRALGNGVETLDSSYSEPTGYMCSVEKVITFGDGVKYPVVVTTAEDYFGRRNYNSVDGYAAKDLFFVITDPQNIPNGTAPYNESAGMLVVIGQDGSVKSILNIVTTTNQLIGGQWVSATDCGYKANSAQIVPFFNGGSSIFEEGDTLIIGRNAGKFDIDGFTAKPARDVLSHYFWAPASSHSQGQGWRNEHSITEYPTFEIKLKNSNQLDAPILSTEGSKVVFAPVEGATSYEVSVAAGDKTYNQTITDTFFDLLTVVPTIGKSGASGVNSSEVEVKVVAKAEGKQDGSTVATYVLSSKVTDGTNELLVTYNLANSLWNSGSGMNLRANDNVSTLMTGDAYKSAVTTYASSNSKNGGIPWYNNGFAVVLNNQMEVKFIRFGYVVVYKIDANGVYSNTDLTFNNSAQNSDVPAGNLLNLENEILDTDYVILGANVGSKTQLTAIVSLFINSDAASIITKVDPTTSETKINPSLKDYSLVFTLTAK